MRKKYLAYVFIVALLLGVWMALIAYQKSTVSVNDGDYSAGSRVTNPEGAFCGGFANIQCPAGQECVITAKHPDAGGTCQ